MGKEKITSWSKKSKDWQSSSEVVSRSVELRIFSANLCDLNIRVRTHSIGDNLALSDAFEAAHPTNPQTNLK